MAPRKANSVTAKPVTGTLLETAALKGVVVLEAEVRVLVPEEVADELAPELAPEIDPEEVARTVENPEDVASVATDVVDVSVRVAEVVFTELLPDCETVVTAVVVSFPVAIPDVEERVRLEVAAGSGEVKEPDMLSRENQGE